MGVTSLFQVGFWRFGIRINRPRTSAEMRARRGGTGEIRMKRKQERMQAYFDGKWRSAWLENYNKDKQMQEAARNNMSNRFSDQVDPATPADQPGEESEPVQAEPSLFSCNASADTGTSSSNQVAFSTGVSSHGMWTAEWQWHHSPASSSTWSGWDSWGDSCSWSSWDSSTTWSTSPISRPYPMMACTPTYALWRVRLPG